MTIKRFIQIITSWEILSSYLFNTEAEVDQNRDYDEYSQGSNPFGGE